MRLLLISPPDFVLRQEVQLLHRFSDAGLETFHLRKPGASVEQYRSYLQQLTPAARKCVVLHYHHGLAQEFVLKGIHYTESARPPPPQLQRRPSLTTSTSFHQLADLQQDWRQGLDYAFLSPIFDSISKVGYTAASFDTAQLQAALSSSGVPLVALGGIKQDNIPVVAAMGFCGVAVLGSVWMAADPEAALKSLLAACRDVRQDATA